MAGADGPPADGDLPLGDLPLSELRRHAHDLADWVADYLERIGTYPVLARVQPGDVAASLPQRAPARGEPLEVILRDVDRVLLPGVTHWNHPGFLAYFANTASVPGILAETMTAALNANAMLWRTSPAATELEAVAVGWLREMMGLPSTFDGHINDTASLSTIVALAAAREQATGGAVRQEGLSGGTPLVLYCSEEAHSSVERAGLLLGLGARGVHRIPVDERFQMDATALAAAIAADRATGRRPMAVVATVGTTSTTSVDPVRQIAEVCAGEGLWLHVDAAYGGAMAVVPEFRGVLDGCDRADSLVVNPHKWLFVPMDCSVLYCREPERIRRAFALVPAYLMTPEEGVARNLMDYGPALGRRFRALKLWMTLRAFGSEGVAARIRYHVRLAREFRGWLEDAPDWEPMAPTPMSTVLFRHRPDRAAEAPGMRELDEHALQAHNEAILSAVNATGRVFLSHTMVRGRYALRVAVGNLRTQRSHLDSAWRLLRQAAAASPSA